MAVVHDIAEMRHGEEERRKRESQLQNARKLEASPEYRKIVDRRSDFRLQTDLADDIAGRAILPGACRSVSAKQYTRRPAARGPWRTFESSPAASWSSPW